MALQFKTENFDDRSTKSYLTFSCKQLFISVINKWTQDAIRLGKSQISSVEFNTLGIKIDDVDEVEAINAIITLRLEL